MEVTIRDNFYNFKVSVESPKDLNIESIGIFDPDKEIHSVYCEGFSKNWVFGSYNKNRSRFTVEIYKEESFKKFVEMIRSES